MRKAFAAIATLALVLATAGAALATFGQTANVQFTTHKAGKSTGVKADVHATWASGDKLMAPKTVVMTFPVNTRFNLRTRLVKRCKYSNAQLTALPTPKVCPKSSRVGTGSGTANLGPDPSPVTSVPLKVQAFVRNASTMVLVANAMGANVVLNAVTRGRKLTIKVPAEDLNGTPVIVTRLKLNVPKKGTGKQALIRTGRCVRKHFTTNVRWTYYNSPITHQVTSTSKCS